MTLIPWRTKREESRGALSPFTGFRSEMDRLFDSFLSDAFNYSDVPGRNLWGPPVDVEETDKEVMVKAEIPGVKPEELDISMHDNTLVISGEKQEKQERKDRGMVYQELRYGSFRREVSLPTAVDPNTVDAQYKDGVLHITLKKSQEAMPKKIQVKTG